MITYKTQPGTIPHRAVAYLRTLPPGTQKSTAELAHAIDADPETIVFTMRPARDAGMVNAEYVPGDKRRLYWSLGNGLQQPTPAEQPDKQPAPTREAAKPKAKKEPKAAPPESSELDANPPTAVKTKRTRTPRLRRNFRVGWFTDGTAHIEIGQHKFVLDSVETAAIADIFKRLK